ncbi:MAG TPA: electron transfer flavoprotein subunit beta/FixA family protein [Dehalococcoidales bacterium]|nr:electron transfer flavoprotein subunit beta/FixA family protein [Dehalococcoidales bacterium]
MNIIVCVKQVIDPEAPPASFKIDPATNKAEMKGAPPVIDPYGEYAVEASLKLKEAKGGKVTVISLGNGLMREVVKKPLAMGADSLVLLEDLAYIDGDSWSTALALAAAVKKVGAFDIILFGREASDTNAGQTGPAVASALGIPCVTLARKIEIIDTKAKIERVTSTGYEVVEVALPVAVTVSNEIGAARYPTIKGIMGAKKIEPLVWKPADLGLEAGKLGAAGKRAKVRKLFQPVHEGKCDFAPGDTPEEMAANLAKKLREAKII